MVTKTFYFVLKRDEIKPRSPFSTETDNFYCLEAPGSTWPASVGFLGLPGLLFLVVPSRNCSQHPKIAIYLLNGDKGTVDATVS